MRGMRPRKAPEHAPAMPESSNTPESSVCSNEDWARYTVDSPREILSLLRTIQQQSLLLDVSFAGGGALTTLLAVDAARSLAVFDAMQDAAANQRLRAAEKIGFSTSIGGVHISFAAAAAEQVIFQQRPAFKIAMPKELIRLQRRDDFRILMPVANPAYCVIPPAPGLNRQPLRATIIDLSCGGVALAEHDAPLNMRTGDVMPDCELLLHEVGPVGVTLKVCNSAQFSLLNGTQKTRLGCRFVDPPASLHAVLQRYILHMERERLQR